VIDNRITAARIAAQLRWSRLKFNWIAGAYQVFCRDGGTSGRPGLPDASGIARQALGYVDVMAVAAGLMRAIGYVAGWSWRVTLGLSSVARRAC